MWNALISLTIVILITYIAYSMAYNSFMHHPLIFLMKFFRNCRDSRGRKQLTPIPDFVPQTNCQVQPYGIQKALVEGKMVPCINFKTYNFKEMLLMTLPDFVSQYFPACDINSCRHVLTDVLGVELYQGNRWAIAVLIGVTYLQAFSVHVIAVARDKYCIRGVTLTSAIQMFRYGYFSFFFAPPRGGFFLWWRKTQDFYKNMLRMFRNIEEITSSNFIIV